MALLPTNILDAAMHGGGRTTRYGDFVIVTLQSMAFATTAMEFALVQRWARSRNLVGNVGRSRMLFAEKFETLLARSGSGVATKGSKKVLSGIVKGMRAGGIPMDGWSIPIDLDAGVEVAKRKGDEAEVPVAAAGAAEPAGVIKAPEVNAFDAHGLRGKAH